MSKIKIVVKRVENVTNEIMDTVVFMTAYNIHNYKHNFTRLWQKNKPIELLNQFHIAGVACKNVYFSSKRKCNYTVKYNQLKQNTEFNFGENFAELKQKDPVFVNEMINTLSLYNFANNLLDTSSVKVNMCFNMERFLAVLEGTIYQVDPVVFFMNDSLIVNFELINFKTSAPLNKSDIYGRNNNFNIQIVEKIKYFDEMDFKDENRTISDIIFFNVIDYVTKVTKNKWSIDDFSYAHNILVLSNEIDNVSNYFLKVLGANIEGFQRENISSTKSFEYYLSESLGVITSIKSSNIHSVLFDCIILESFKTYLLLKMVVDYEITHKLDKIIDSQIFIESLFYPAHAPIITTNLIDNLRKTDTFSRYKQAVEFKVQAMKIMQDRQRTNNGMLLNVLLYVLTMIGSAQTLQVLDNEFGLPFDISFWVVMVIFVLFGMIWGLRELRKR